MASRALRVSVVIPNWNGERLLRRHLPQVVGAARNPKNEIAEIVVVDDGSTDGSVELLEKEFSEVVRLIKHTKNRGFSSAVNTGVRMAKGNLVCLLNTDVSPSDDFLKNVVGHFKKENVFGVSLHEKGYGGARGMFRNGFLEHKGAVEASEAYQSFWANGGSAVFRREIWMKLKGFDEELFNPFYWEDIDLCYRAQKRGYVILWEPKAKVLHEHESVINESNFRRRRLDIIKERNQLLFIWKNITSQRLFRKHIGGLIKRIIRYPGYLIVFLVAARKLKQVRKLRKIEKKEASVSDEAILARFQEK